MPKVPRRHWPKGKTADRGYGGDHTRLRRQWAARIKQGGVYCARCGREILPWHRWHLDHNDDRTGYLGPSHARCNSVAAGRKSGLLKQQRLVKRVQRAMRHTSREW